MPDTNLYSASDDPNPDDYKILRKGSVYNIIGPYGREFRSYKSASIVGPRWEELTHIPWPYESSAYTSGLRLWELGIIPREFVGMRKSLIGPDPALPSKSRPPDQPKNEELLTESLEPESPSIKQPPHESASKERTSLPVQQTLRPAEKVTPHIPKSDPLSAGKEKPVTPQIPPSLPSKPRQHRLMFQENWDDYREPIKPDSTRSKQESSESPDTDAEDD